MQTCLTRKEKIINQAKIEFANYLYEEASINRIIKEISMPRGTFYLCFKNKEELYLELLNEFKNNFIEFSNKIKEKNDGDIKISLLEIFDHIVNSENKLIKNVLINFNTTHYIELLPDFNDKHIYFDKFNFSKYNFKDEEEKMVFMRLLLTIMIKNVCLANNYDGDARRKFEIQLNIILKGIE